MKQIGVWVTWAAMASVVSCAGGTETENPAALLKDFSSSTCKNKNPNPAPQALVVASDADGLQCVEWSLERDTLEVKLINFPEGCSDRYLGKARLAPNTLELSVYTERCAVAACGSCLFDFDYAIAGVRSDAPLLLRVGSAVCEQDPPLFNDELTLPLDERPSGVVCRPIPEGALSWYSRTRGSCGERNMPCGDCTSDADQTSCDPGLTCSELGERDSRCLAQCTSDDECTGGLTTCEEGVCRASPNW
jgi:hypothetical protein